MRIQVRGAREHNLHNVDVDFGDGLTVLTGVSGSGKSSLAFDTVYHEARRRFLDAFGRAGARLPPAAVDSLTGAGPAVAVAQNLLNRNPLSTVASASGLHPFLRLLFSRFSQRSCARCGTGISVLSAEEIAHAAKGGRVFAGLVRGAPGSHRTLIRFLRASFPAASVFVDGRPAGRQALRPRVPHSIEVLLDAFRGSHSSEGAVRKAVESAVSFGATSFRVSLSNGELLLSNAPQCPTCGTPFRPLEPVLFHTPCPSCRGRGCRECQGTGLHPEAAAARWQGMAFREVLSLSVSAVARLFGGDRFVSAASRLREELARRTAALQAVGLGYVTLDRPVPSLSRGEAQRLRLAVALSSRLEDILHILDEPTIGLHPEDVGRVLPAFRRLGGPVIFVEHDRLAAAFADRAVDLGPSAGPGGGRILYDGTPAGLLRSDTPTGRCFRPRRSQPPLRALLPLPERFLRVRGASLHNLRSIDVELPLSRLTAVTGVSGSGKSTLVQDVLIASLLSRRPVGCLAVETPTGMRAPRVVVVDQSPIGINPRSTPATYTKLADHLRDIFAQSTGLDPSRFSFNRPEGACPECHGLGAVEVRLRLLPSTWIVCESCGGDRFSDEVLAAAATLGGKRLSIAELYRLPLSEIRDLLASEPEAAPVTAALRILDALCDTGLGYLSLGRSSPTLSGGEAQRIKLASRLGRPSLANSLLVLDEPSTGLHPADLNGLIAVLDRLVRAGATVIVVEHNTDVIRAADWVVDLGPGSGPEGGRLVYAGPVQDMLRCPASRTGRALAEETALPRRGARAGTPAASRGTAASRRTTAPRRTAASRRPAASRRTAASRRPAASRRTAPISVPISVRGARANNLAAIDVDFPKSKITVVTGLSGCGKSSLVCEVLEAEAGKRFLETLSMYERQGVKEGPEVPADSVTGLGVTVSVRADHHRMYNPRNNVGLATGMTHQLAVVLAFAGRRRCPSCGAPLRRGASEWVCPTCGHRGKLPEPRLFLPRTYAGACFSCHGLGSVSRPRPEKLIVHPDKPLCGGAMHSPGFFPQGYLCRPFNGGYDMVQALAGKHGFDPASTPWEQMSEEARSAFLFGEKDPLPVVFRSRKGVQRERTVPFRGFYGWVGDWDTTGTYSEIVPCPDCAGSGLREEFASVTLGNAAVGDLLSMPLSDLAGRLAAVRAPAGALWAPSLRGLKERIGFLREVGLGYVSLKRLTSTLSAGEAQRVKIAGLLGGGLSSLTVILDEPTRGMHPSEVQALVSALERLRDDGNTVIVVEHDPQVIKQADRVLELGPGAGARGGRIVADGCPRQVAALDTPTGRVLARVLRQDTRARRAPRREARPARAPTGWLTIREPRANNLRDEEVRIPLGVLCGVCGVSGSGKSTLIVDTLGRALCPVKHTTSISREPVEPGRHASITGAPGRTLVVDQARPAAGSVMGVFGLERVFQEIYAKSEEAQASGLTPGDFRRRCPGCRGSGSIRIDMGFLPDSHQSCEVCGGTGFPAEVRSVRLRGKSLGEVLALTVEETHELWADEERISRCLQWCRRAGLGYLVLRQTSLSGGEAQRLKLASELGRANRGGSLFLLDEPTVGLHAEDTAALVTLLRDLVLGENSVVVVEHSPQFLASCDWLIELGPGAAAEGGRVVAQGPPDLLMRGRTATAPYIREAMA